MTMNEWRGNWWDHPDRPCKNRPEYADLSLVRPKARPRVSRAQQIQDMADACLTCPVLRQCRTELLSTSKTWEHYGIQAGIIGKA